MNSTTRLVAACVAVSLALGGPLAARAQAPVPPAPLPPATSPQPPAPQPSPQGGMTPAQPELFPEGLKTPREPARGDVVYQAGAVVVNIIRVPGKGFLCVLGGGISVAILALTFGNSYKAAASILNEGCGGKWILGPDDLRPDGAATYRETTATTR